MTDKQIIDKCPISEKCKEFENCKIQNILQQLQAKEQECEKLKEEKQGLIKDWEEKKNLGYEIACKNEKLKAENEALKNNNVFSIRLFKDKADKYEQVLKEIKEIAKNGCYDDCGMPLDELCIILQKISEVIDE